MLSYRHAFHAGNHADVLKHLTLMLIIEHMTCKDKGLLYLDTHAGSGQYSLNSHYANHTLEFKSGIETIWNQSDLPEPLSRFISLISSFNSESCLNTYPGSPVINKPESRQLPKKLMALPAQSHLSVTLHVGSKSGGMTGSGLVVLNPPWTLKDELEKSLPTLTRLLRQDRSAHFELNYQET